MKKLFLLLFAIFLTANVFAYDDTPYVSVDHIYGKYVFGIWPNPSYTAYYYGVKWASVGNNITCTTQARIYTNSFEYGYFSSNGYLNSTHPGVPTPSFSQPEYVMRATVYTINERRRRLMPYGYYKYSYGTMTGADGRTWQYDEVWKDGNYNITNGVSMNSDYQQKGVYTWPAYSTDSSIFIGLCK